MRCEAPADAGTAADRGTRSEPRCSSRARQPSARRRCRRAARPGAPVVEQSTVRAAPKPSRPSRPRGACRRVAALDRAALPAPRDACPAERRSGKAPYSDQNGCDRGSSSVGVRVPRAPPRAGSGRGQVARRHLSFRDVLIGVRGSSPAAVHDPLRRVVAVLDDFRFSSEPEAPSGLPTGHVAVEHAATLVETLDLLDLPHPMCCPDVELADAAAPVCDLLKLSITVQEPHRPARRRKSKRLR